ncbi:methyltransferase family protein [Planctomycetota bacterium]
MTRYERLFGAGPRGIAISLMLFVLAWLLKSAAGLPSIADSAIVRWTIFVLSIMISGSLAVWSFKSLPATARGTDLITSGPYKYLRHPLYACLLSSFNFGLAMLLNNWIFLIWALVLHPLWHWNIRREEKLMTKTFPNEYAAYCKVTGRFLPKIFPPKH